MSKNINLEEDANRFKTDATINDNYKINPDPVSKQPKEQQHINNPKEREKKSINKNPYELVTIDICHKLLCCCFRTKKHRIFENAENKFDHNIDMVNYMKKMQELDILKYLILDENTLQLMNFISKPCISMSSNGIQDEEYKLFFDSYDDNIRLSHKNIDNVKKCYDIVSMKKHRNTIEDRILKLFELQILEILQ
jgi:hypothetical protein